MTPSQQGLDDFARAHLPRLLRYAAMLTGDHDLAQDIVQDVMTKAQRVWPRIAAADSPERYVTTMITNAFLSWRRRWSVRHVFAVDDVPDRSEGDPAGALAERDAIWRRLATLAPRQRASIVLRYYEDLPDDEIAAILGCAAVTVRTHIHRGLAALRLELDADEIVRESR